MWLLNPYRFGGWTPANITTDVWLDAADASTITLNGSTVSQWNDKSGNNRHVSQATAIQQPSWNATGLNDKPILTFDGVNDILLNQNAGSIGVTSVTILIVMRFISLSQDDMPFALGQSGQSQRIRALYRQSLSTNLGFATWANDITTTSIEVDEGNNYHIYGLAHLAPRTLVMFKDGSAATGNPFTLPADSLPVNFDGLSLGSLQGPQVSNFYSNVAISEVVVIYDYLELAAIQQTFGYLAHKWGLTANLPSDHPYKSVAP